MTVEIISWLISNKLSRVGQDNLDKKKNIEYQIIYMYSQYNSRHLGK